MNVMIHDLEQSQFKLLFPDIDVNTRIISDKGCIKNCTGCFGCWLKTPGTCVRNDGYETMGEMLSQADHVMIISKCYYGGYSPFIKTVFDRSISYLLPFFRTVGEETHHKQRYEKTFRLSVYFYGDAITPQEMDTAKRLVRANSINFYIPQHQVSFYNSLHQLSKEVDIL